MRSMSFVSGFARGDVALVGGATVIILFAIVITASFQGGSEKQMSQIITVGPVWDTNNWLCTSSEEYLVHGVLIAYNNPSRLEIFISGSGEQPDFILQPNEMESFTVGGVADSSIRISKLTGTITGFITMQTASDANASCDPI